MSNPQKALSGLQAFQKLVEKLKEKLAASSCTFYIKDRLWKGQFQLLAMPGVDIKEPMYGLTSGTGFQNLTGDEDPEKFVKDVRGKPEFRAHILPSQSRGKRVPKLFGDFVERENVVSCARLIYKNALGAPEMVLFVNYQRVTSFSKNRIAALRSAFREMIAAIGPLKDEIAKLDEQWLSEGSRILSPAWNVANEDLQGSDSPDNYFNQIVTNSLEVLGIPVAEGLATLHLYNAEQETLELHGRSGRIENPDRAMSQLVKKRQGVISWVLLRGRAVLITDLAKSEFRHIQVWLNNDVKSELAVPLQAQGELIGSLCVESIKANAFLPHQVRSLWYAANQAAIAYQLHRHSSMIRKLLQLCSNATNAPSRTSLNEVATLARDYLKASFCEIWRFNPNTETLDDWGTSYPGFSPHSRPEGWTKFARKHAAPVWIGNIHSKSKFSAAVWRDGDWIDARSFLDAPPEINPKPLQQGVKAELGIPVTIRNKCIGIAWIKYKRPGLLPPDPRLMTLAQGFAAEAGLVIELTQRQQMEHEMIEAIGSGITERIQDRWQLGDGPIVEAHVKSEPLHSRLGGDFYAGRIIDQNTVGLLLIDGMAHGIPGSLSMLPLMAAFESCSRSESTIQVIAEMRKTADALSVSGEAIYGILSRIDDQIWLSVTSAGKLKFIIFRQDKDRFGWTYEFFPKHHAEQFGHPLRQPLLVDTVALGAGDVIIGFTDGIAEPTAPFNLTSIAQLVLETLDSTSDPRKLAASIFDKASEARDLGKIAADDATVFVARVKA